MSFDSVANLKKVIVSTGYSSVATSIVLGTGQGALLPAAPFNMTWWNVTAYPDPSADPNVEIVRVTVISGDTLTVLRAQEATAASSKNTPGGTYLMSLGPTAKTITDLENAIEAKTFITVGFQAGCDFVCTGTNDGAVIMQALNSMPAGGGKIVFRNGTYAFSQSSDRCSKYASNIVLEGESYGGVIFQAQGSIGSTRFGMLTVGGTGSVLVSGVVVRNIVFDCNNIADAAGLTVWGGAGAAGQITLQDVLLENVLVKNHTGGDGGEAGLYIIGGDTNNYGQNGCIDQIMFRNVEACFGAGDGWWIYGSNFTNLTFVDCKVHDNIVNGVNYIIGNGAGYDSTDWTLQRCRFWNNMTVQQSYARADFRDSNQGGVANLLVDDCYFGPVADPTFTQNYIMTPYFAPNNRITNCVFYQAYKISLGFSHSGQENQLQPLTQFLLSGNIFYQTQGYWDGDSCQYAIFSDNIFYEVQYGSFDYYSQHFPTAIQDNLFYNCNVLNTNSDPAYQQAALVVGAEGNVVRGNYVIDDRLLVNPVNAPSVNQVAGGSLGARTYYVKITIANSTGETSASPEQAISVSANNLVTVGWGGPLLPSGATNVNVYIWTSSGAEVYQGTIELPAFNVLWTEPATGLVSGGATPPVSNTTHTLTIYGVYESAGAFTGGYPTIYENNYFIGIQNPVYRYSGYPSISRNNYAAVSYASGTLSLVEKLPYAAGNITGTAAITTLISEVTAAMLTGNVTFTFAAGEYIGQQMQLILTQDGTGSRIATWPGNFLKAGGSLALSTSPGAVDQIVMFWNGADWLEQSRSLGLA